MRQRGLFSWVRLESGRAVRAAIAVKSSMDESESFVMRSVATNRRLPGKTSLGLIAIAIASIAACHSWMMHVSTSGITVPSFANNVRPTVVLGSDSLNQGCSSVAVASASSKGRKGSIAATNVAMRFNGNTLYQIESAKDAGLRSLLLGSSNTAHENATEKITVRDHTDAIENAKHAVVSSSQPIERTYFVHRNAENEKAKRLGAALPMDLFSGLTRGSNAACAALGLLIGKVKPSGVLPNVIASSTTGVSLPEGELNISQIHCINPNAPNAVRVLCERAYTQPLYLSGAWHVPERSGETNTTRAMLVGIVVAVPTVARDRGPVRITVSEQLNTAFTMSQSIARRCLSVMVGCVEFADAGHNQVRSAHILAAHHLITSCHSQGVDRIHMGTCSVLALSAIGRSETRCLVHTTRQWGHQHLPNLST
jgi:hypothetical protein